MMLTIGHVSTKRTTRPPLYKIGIDVGGTFTDFVVAAD